MQQSWWNRYCHITHRRKSYRFDLGKGMTLKEIFQLAGQVGVLLLHMGRIKCMEQRCKWEGPKSKNNRYPVVDDLSAGEKHYNKTCKSVVHGFVLTFTINQAVSFRITSSAIVIRLLGPSYLRGRALRTQRRSWRICKTESIVRLLFRFR